MGPKRKTRAILRRGDTDRIYDRVKPGEGRLPGEARVVPPLPEPVGVALSHAERERLREVVCDVCQRFAPDCAMLTEHQNVANVVRVVILDDSRAVELDQVAA